jgi:hypothetical protein
MKERAKKQRFEEIDEHYLPTEPMARVVFSPDAYGAPTIDEPIPVPQPQERPFPAQGSARLPNYYERGPASVYPYLPPAPAISKRHRPAGGVAPFSAGPERWPEPQVKRRNSALPVLVGWFFVLVQLLLLVRFALSLIGVSRDIGWVDVIYVISNIFVLPFRLLLQSITLPIPISIEVYTVLAILAYGLLSRLLVRLLKLSPRRR